MPEHIFNEGVPGRDPNVFPVFTRARNPIPTLSRGQLPTDEMWNASIQLVDANPRRRLRSVDNTYNCVGMIFASRRAWIESTEFDWIAAQDGYLRVSQPEVGDLVVYRRNAVVEHVGVILEKSVQAVGGYRTLSKWGADGEFVHDIDDLPELLISSGLSTEYWSERKRPHR